MADSGIKITKQGKGIESTDPNDYILWTKYKTLMLLGKRSDGVVFTHGEMGGTVTIPHGFDFIPFVLMYVVYDNTPYYKVPYLLDTDIYSDYARWYDSGGEQVTESIDARIDSTNIYFDWTSFSWNPQMGDSYPATTIDGGETVITYFYNLELGRVLPD